MAVEVEIKKRHYNTDTLRDGEVRVGWFEGVRYDDSTPVAKVARAHEFGYGVPRRSFVRPTIHRNESIWIQQLSRAYTQAIVENRDTRAVLQRFGLEVKNAIQREILTGDFKPLSEATIKAKGGRTKPLIDTWFMFHSIGVQVGGEND